ncbi:MAG TPA: hypothetical protein VNQ55_05905 [Parapedobacter sp.]|nr:hypothetical protein [Parapedobacter sp.]
MIRKIFFALAIFGIQASAYAGQKFSCGDAEVRVDIVSRNSASWELRAEAVISVTANEVSTVLRYWGNTDFIGAACVMDSTLAPKVVYQAFCGGSGCRDLDNWGIIDPKSLRVLLVPSDTNRTEAMRLLGKPLPELPEKLNLYVEAKRLGIDVP